MLTRMALRRAKIVGTTFGTRESILRRSRGSSPWCAHSSVLRNRPEIVLTEPCESRIVHRSRMFGESDVSPPLPGSGGSSPAARAVEVARTPHSGHASRGTRGAQRAPSGRAHGRSTRTQLHGARPPRIVASTTPRRPLH